MGSRRSLSIFLAFAVSLLCGFGLIAPAAPVLAADPIVVDSFEAGLPAGYDADGVAVGFNTFQDPNSSVAISTTAASLRRRVVAQHSRERLQRPVRKGWGRTGRPRVALSPGQSPEPGRSGR